MKKLEYEMRGAVWFVKRSEGFTGLEAVMDLGPCERADEIGSTYADIWKCRSGRPHGTGPFLIM